MPVDTFAKRMTVAHVKRPGRGVFPGTTNTLLGRGAMAWNYVSVEPPPPTPGGLGGIQIGIGQKRSFSNEPILGGGGSW